METPTEKAERLAANWSILIGGPVGMAECGCPNNNLGAAPALHICRRCGFEGGYDTVHRECAGCVENERRDLVQPFAGYPGFRAEWRLPPAEQRV